MAPRDCASGACTTNKCGPWSKTVGGSSDDWAFAVAFDSQGNVVVVGDFGGTVDFGGGNVTAGGATSGFLVKYSPSGAFLWAKTFGGGNGAHGYGVLVMPNDDIVLAGGANDRLDFGGGVLIGQIGGNAIIARYTSTGQYVWAQGFPCGSGGCVAGALALAPGGDIFVTGQALLGGIDFGGGPIPGHGDNDVFVARLKGTDGTPLWSKLFGGSGADLVSGVAGTKDGDVVLSGEFFQDTIDFGGPSYTSTYWDIFLVRLQGGSGDYVWSKTFNGGFNDLAGMVRVDSANNIVFGGQIEGAGDLGGGPISVPGLKAFVAKYAPDGTFTWARVSNPDGYAYAYSVALDTLDGVVAVGSFQSATVGFGGSVINNVTGVGDDMFIAKYSATNAPVFSAGYGGAGIDAFRSVAVFPPTGNIVAVGYFQQTVDVGDGPKVSNGMTDAIIASLGPSVP